MTTTVRPLRPDRTETAPTLLHAELQFRRHALLSLLAIAFFSALVTLCLALLLDFETRDKIWLAFVTAKNLAFFLWLKRSRRSFALVGFLHFTILGVAAVQQFAEAVLVQQLAGGLGGYSYWLPLTYVVAFLAFRAPTAILTSLGVFIPCLMIGVAFWSSPAIPAALKLSNAYLFVQLYLTHAAFISIFVCLALLLGRYMHAIRAAEHEARSAYTDDLTGLPNRRQLTLWLSNHLARPGEPLSVILFDLDHFKQVNDAYGHEAGDRVLRETALAVTGALRRGELFGRWGGEEFLVILENADEEQAKAVAERVRAAVGAVEHRPGGTVTASCGVAQAAPHETLQGLLKRADEASYAAKRAGRNCVRTAA